MKPFLTEMFVLSGNEAVEAGRAHDQQSPFPVDSQSPEGWKLFQSPLEPGLHLLGTVREISH